jgi:hypothetical protein
MRLPLLFLYFLLLVSEEILDYYIRRLNGLQCTTARNVESSLTYPVGQLD